MQVRYAPLSNWARSVSSIRLTASAGCSWWQSFRPPYSMGTVAISGIMRRALSHSAASPETKHTGTP